MFRSSLTLFGDSVSPWNIVFGDSVSPWNNLFGDSVKSSAATAQARSFSMDSNKFELGVSDFY